MGGVVKRGFVSATASSESSQPFRPLCLRPENSVSPQRRLRFEETGSSLEESRSRRLGALAKSALASELSPGHGGAIVSSAPGATAEFVLAPSCLVFRFR